MTTLPLVGHLEVGVIQGVHGTLEKNTKTNAAKK